MTARLIAAALLLASCAGSAPRPAGSALPERVTASRPDAQAPDSCGAATDSTVAFAPAARALSQFMTAALAGYADRVPPDRLTFPVTGCDVARLDIVDLYDQANAYTATGDRVYFAPGHAYHVYAVWPSVSFSHLAFVEPDTVVVFRAVNCTDSADSADDALAYLRAHHPERWSPAYEARIRAYREAGDFSLTDDIVPQLLCPCEICYLPPSKDPARRR